MTRCGVCGRTLAYGNNGWRAVDGRPHPLHTDAELAETKVAVDAAAKILFARVMARLIAQGLAA